MKIIIININIIIIILHYGCCAFESMDESANESPWNAAGNRQPGIKGDEGKEGAHPEKGGALASEVGMEGEEMYRILEI